MDNDVDAGRPDNTNAVFSVVLATYNSSRYLREQLDSILVQTHAPAEIVVSDDGSTDDTLDILGEYARRDSRIVVVRNPAEGRRSNRINGNFENAVRRCTGSWVAFSDHDDIWLPEKLEVLYANRHDMALIYGRSDLVDAAGRSMGATFEKYLGFPEYFSGPVPPYVLLDTNTVSGHALIVRRTLVEAALPFPDGITYDHWLALLARCKGGIRFVDEPVVLHRIHTENSVHYVRPRGRRPRPNLRKRWRYCEAIARKAEVLRRLQAFEADLEPVDRAFLGEYLEHVRSAPARYFDLRYLMAAFPMRRRLYSKKAAWRLFNECIGGRCYWS
ncbi:MAG: hypothetical protein B7Z66_12610 [Chromatiales bacterium 21-64-14]|nr:MAG: hypothetical protein B7Z66_12610 [Chromatiales bacterium 21-64-14]HQU17032.1 glycosyltransferase [Gammaproteobacteria bacterium]